MLVSIDHWLPSLHPLSVGSSTCLSLVFTAFDFSFVVQDCPTSTTNCNNNVERRSVVSLSEQTFLGSRSFIVNSLWLVH